MVPWHGFSRPRQFPGASGGFALGLRSRQSNPGGLPDDVAHTDASLKSQRAAAQAGAARVVSHDPLACRVCNTPPDTSVPAWHPDARREATCRAVTLRVWRGTHLRVRTVEDWICLACAEFYGRVQGRAA